MQHFDASLVRLLFRDPLLNTLTGKASLGCWRGLLMKVRDDVDLSLYGLSLTQSLIEPSSRQTETVGDSKDYFSQYRPHHPRNGLCEYKEPCRGCSPGGNAPTDLSYQDRS